MTTLRLKDNDVDISGLDLSMVRALPVIISVFSEYDVDTIITSGLDGEHMNGSFHYVGKALDFRTRHLPGGSTGQAAKEVAGKVAQRLKFFFGDAYDVLGKTTHIHVEHDPR